VLVTGPTGSGKTILASLIPRFYDPSAGRVLLDGADVRGLSLADLRRAVSVIFQDTFLFSMTIAENIAYGRPDASRDDIERCARAAQIHDFIAGLERGYDTVIGERGMSLSGGQKQRVAIARALLMDPRVLILDDATASVDAETERKLEAAMTSLAAGRTAIVIAQRLSTVLEADRIVFIDEGRVVAEGAHPELLADCEGYAAIFAAQAAPALQLPVEAAA
jgi:ATP-binding cassette subfamily B protein